MTVPVRLVFSDVDETLIHCKSMFDFLDFHFVRTYGPRGALRAREVRENLAALTAGGTPREHANRVYYRAWAGEPAHEVAASGADWFAERSADERFYVRATRDALLGHRADGAAIVLVSGSFPAILDPIAADVGPAQVVCSLPEVRGGVLTGELVGEPVIGEEKRTAVRRLLRAHPHIDAADCHAYGDHVSDLPMLTEVGHPVVVGDPDLARRLPGSRFLPADAGAPSPVGD
ncbi:HAD family phosphatase [Streptomyces sp. NBC_00847]|uniref:HAD family hydrolase n=1 Tax=Streptomyces sp. NBC_00847 TaxID=2975850 RepID=UPI00224FDE4C|nr:HAD-IB family hydrolase [Streptomyces sp. NBC_00847]MCX4883160.1 HAD-IB family hydrolase [Streptomyces sp. NBC_00847]